MNGVLFDTFKVSEDLQAAGLTPEQAKAVTRAIEAGRAIDLSHLATKADLQELRTELKADVAVLRGEIATVRAELEILRRDLTIRLGSMLVVAVGVIISAFGVFRYLPPLHP